MRIVDDVERDKFADLNLAARWRVYLRHIIERFVRVHTHILHMERNARAIQHSFSGGKRTPYKALWNGLHGVIRTHRHLNGTPFGIGLTRVWRLMYDNTILC